MGYRTLSHSLALGIISCYLIFTITVASAAIPESKCPLEEEEEESQYYGKLWCARQDEIRSTGKRHCDDVGMVLEDESKEFNPILNYFLSLFVMIGYGALIRGLLRATGLPIPYTVILMISGLLFGVVSKHFCTELYSYTAITRTPSPIILFIFLPVLIFESAFSIPVHCFMKSLSQILVTAFPGMLIGTLATAGVCLLFLRSSEEEGYGWTFIVAMLFGSIISATDPVAVVAILREVGTSEMLSVAIEGESLLNDGVAILMYKVFEEILTCEIDSNQPGAMIGTIILMFIQIAIGGPAFGWVMAKITIFFLSKIFNDATVEITITLCAAYLTYFIGDHMLKVSGVMAVVALGLTLSSERTCISPEVEASVHHFWEMLGYLANTVLFVFVGVIISEQAINFMDWRDLYYLGFLWVALNLIRFLMLLVLSPILCRIGYGLKWENMIIMMWGGLRGAVGLCLALEVYGGTLCKFNQHNPIGPKFLIQTAGIVILTLVVNGCTTETLLKILRLTEISQGRLQDMSNAVRQLKSSQNRTLAMLKHDRFLADANWKVVDDYTGINDPYKKIKEKRRTTEIPSILSLHQDDRDHVTECNVCHNLVQNEPTEAEFIEMTEEARLRLIKALTVSYWRQFEHGVLTELALQHLVSVSETVEDKELMMVHCNDFRRYWTIRGAVKFFRTIFFSKKLNSLANKSPEGQEPTNPIIRFCWKIVTNIWFDVVMMIIIIVNILILASQIYYFIKEPSEEHTWFRAVNYFFTACYTLEFILKVIGLRQNYFKSIWNLIDMVVLILSYTEFIFIAIYEANHKSEAEHHRTIKSDVVSLALRYAKFFRLIRLIRLPSVGVPVIRRYLLELTNQQLFLGYDIGKGFVQGIDDVMKFLPQMVDHPKVLAKLKKSLQTERLATVREMGLLQKDHPGIAIAVKTRHASRQVLNQMREALNELKEDGLVDEKEDELLTILIEEHMKKLWSSPASIPPSDPHVLLANISWIVGNEKLSEFIRENALLKNFNFGEKICVPGEQMDGIYLIISGMVKINYQPTPEIVAEMEKGKIPNSELFMDISFRTEQDDFVSTGTVLGEIGALTGDPRAVSVICETGVTAYHFPQDILERAFEQFNEKTCSLRSRIWRAIGMKLGRFLLPTQPFYQAWTLDKIRLHLEKSGVPIGDEFEELKFPSYVSDVILLQGQVRNFHKKDLYKAPCLLPRSCLQITKVPEGKVKPILMIVAQDDVDRAKLSPSQANLYEYIDPLAHLPEPKQARRGTLAMAFGEKKVTGNSSIAKVFGLLKRKKRYSVAPLGMTKAKKKDPKSTSRLKLPKL